MHGFSLLGKPNKVKQLIRESADANTRNHNGATPLMLAAYRDKDITSTLLNAGAGRSINWADQAGRTVWDYALQDSRIDVEDILET